MADPAKRRRPAPDPYLAICPSRGVMSRLGEKWALLVLIDLANGPKRFGHLRKRIEGVSQKMLTQTLRNLERDGLLMREVLSDRPIQVAYSLTPMGETLLPVAAALKTWVQAHYLAIERQNRRYDALFDT
jgi:DNA-binding HxlR family transcriptional regulator